jgi:hypothetical protein
MLKSFRSLRKFFRVSIVRDTPFDERLSHHEGREGHEDRITEMASNQKNVLFLRALRALRGDIHFLLVVSTLSQEPGRAK